jgi:hypothetical protein
MWISFGLDAMLRGKTNRWRVATLAGETLGYVKWWGAWRKYAFFPLASTLYEEKCLRDIAEFCERETKALRASWRKRTAA